MTILSVIQNVCLAIGVDRPETVVSSDDRQMMEIMRLAQKVAVLIRDSEFDWQALQRMHTIAGDDVAGSFELPADYARMPTKTTLWSSRWTWGMNQVSGVDTWLEMQVTPYVSVTGDWIIYDDKIHVLPVMATTETIKFFYISENMVKPQDGEAKAVFSDDNDTFRLSEEALEYGIILKFREQKGQPIDEEENDFKRALYNAMNTDGGSKQVVSGNARRRYDSVKPAYPFKVPN